MPLRHSLVALLDGPAPRRRGDHQRRTLDAQVDLAPWLDVEELEDGSGLTSAQLEPVA